ncbi:MAG: histidine kinase dimerization/phospho-acceptor domain-containing protein, partial [Angelakisella sp.]
MKNKSVFRRYFQTCASIILISISFLGVVFLAFASQYFKEDKYKLLSQSLDLAVEFTRVDMQEGPGNSIFFSPLIPNSYKLIGKSVDADVYLVDLNGNVIVGHSAQGAQTGMTVSPVIMSFFHTGDVYTETGKLGGMYPSPHYTVGKPLFDSQNRVVGAVFASTSAAALTTFLADIFQMFLISAVVVMLFAFIIVYFITNSMVRPLQEMLAATHSFSQGDFSIRVPVEGDDEIALLSASFNAMASSLATLEQTRRSFTANVSHELKTPMTTIGGFIDGILDGTIPPEKQNHYLRIVSSEIQRLSRLVRSMLNISRIEAGELKINPVPVEITDIVTRTTLIFEKQLTDKNIEVRGLDIDEKYLVQADPDLI